MKKLILVFFLFHSLISSVAFAETYYVDKNHPKASDQNAGTEDLPWMTLQYAANTIKPGDTVIVKPGSYGRILVRQGGNEQDGWKTFIGAQEVSMDHIPFDKLFDTENPVHTSGDSVRNAVTRGFVLTPPYGSGVPVTHVSILSFEITSVQKEGEYFYNVGAIYLSNTQNIEIAGNLFHDINGPRFNCNGISADGINNENVHVRDNRFFRVQGIAINMSGTNWVVERNRISNGLSHRTDNGEYVMGDADGIRFYGSGHSIRDNWIHDFLDEEQGTASPHMDCFQTFSNNGTYAYNILIERNWCEKLHQMTSTSDLWERDGGEDMIHNITFRGNVAYGMRACALDIDSYCNDFIIENNTFARGNLSVGNGFTNKKLTGMIFQNNILYERSTTQISSASDVEFWDHNLHYPDFEYPPRAPGYDENSLFGEDPLFVDPDNPKGLDGIPFTDDDGLCLTENSPAVKRGRDGVDIGAYNYINPADINVNTGGGGSLKIPIQHNLRQNYPNPFNPNTMISYLLHGASEVELKIYDILGREVITLVNQKRDAGEYTVEWNGTNSAGQQVSSGIYFYKMKTASGYISSKKMLMLR